MSSTILKPGKLILVKPLIFDNTRAETFKGDTVQGFYLTAESFGCGRCGVKVKADFS